MIAKSVSLTSGIAIPQACLARGNVVRSSAVKTANLADAPRADRGDLPQEGLTAAVTGRDGGVAASGPPPAAAYSPPPRLGASSGGGMLPLGRGGAAAGSGMHRAPEPGGRHRGWASAQAGSGLR